MILSLSFVGININTNCDNLKSTQNFLYILLIKIKFYFLHLKKNFNSTYKKKVFS